MHCVSTEMNSDSKRERPVELAGKMERAEKKRQLRDVIHQKRGDNILASSGGRGIQDLSELNGYQPTHEKSRTSYESLLVCCCF